MTVRKGSDWGEIGPLHANARIAVGDADAAAILSELLTEQSPIIEVGLVGGDMHRTVGAPRHSAAELYGGKGLRLPVDLGVVEFEVAGQVSRHHFLSHVVATSDRRARWWRTRTVIAMNAAFIGPYNLGPRSHPDDGRIDVTDGQLPRGDRRRALERAVTGTHVPHPGLSVTRVKQAEYFADKQFHISIDSSRVAHSDRFTIRCIPDAAVIVV